MSRRDKDRDDRDDRPATKAEKKPPVIELHHNHGLTAGEAILKRLLPAAVVSAGIHLLIAVGAFLVSMLVPVTVAAPPVARVDMAVEEKTETPRDENLTEPMVTIHDDIGPTGVQDVPLADVNIDTELNKSTDPVGVSDGQVQEKLDTLKAIGAPSDLNTVSGIDALGPNAGMSGAGNQGTAMLNPGLLGRKPGSRDAMVKTGGGNTESEAAVARGLAWLARVQKKDGTWVYDIPGGGGDLAASTGMGLLPFLAAGQTHKGASKDNKYKENVTAAIAALLKLQKPDGGFSGNTYAHAIATVALCEAFGMTGDKALLLKPCQLAIDKIQKGQAGNGSWGYTYERAEGDTSIVGWQVQALHSAKMCKEIRVDPKVLEKAMKFLDTVASKPPKVTDKGGKVTFNGASSMSAFGYSNPGPRPGLTAVGLLCRYYLNGWGPNSPGLRDGVDYIMAAHPPDKDQEYDLYYYYYATQVAHFREGETWAKDWNPKMRDMLIAKQVSQPNRPTVDGSWDKDDRWIGDKCGRMGTTAMAILTLEVYYRHLPLYGRGTGALNELDRK